MARIPFKPSKLKTRHVFPKWIVIHHTFCPWGYTHPTTRVDNPSFQSTGLTVDVLKKKDADVNFHFVVEQIKDEFFVMAFRPVVTECFFEDIHPDINKRAIHLAVLGNYDLKVPEKRLYEVFSYRLINPFLTFTKIPISRVIFHNEVGDENTSCPGFFFNKVRLITLIRKYVIK